MLFPSWLRNWKRSMERRSALHYSLRRKPSGRCWAPHPRLEILEDRTLLSPYIVTSTADNGTGSLRDAINQINLDTSHALYASPNNPNVDEIDFNITAASDAAGGGTGYNATTGVATIQPGSALPQISNSVILDGSTQPGYSGTPLIELNGSSAGSSANGLNITAGDSTVRGLVIDQFGQDGILLSSGGGDLIVGNYIGTDVSGTKAQGNGNNGVDIVGGSNNRIGANSNDVNAANEGNLISGNGGNGVSISGNVQVISSETLADQFNAGDFPRQVATGTIAQADMSDQTAPATGDWPYNNPIPGGGGVNYAFVATGTIQVNTPGTYTFDSGSDDGSRLLINGQEVVDEPNPEPFAENFGSVTLTAGTHTIQWTGYQQYGGAGFELSVADGGGMTGPVTAANGWHVLGDPNPDPAISLQGSLSVTVSYSQPQGGQDNVVAGNYIGTNAAGNPALGNGHSGILVENGAQNNTIGGTGTWDRNVISGNKGTINAGSFNFPSEADGGVSINSASNNLVEGNRIGTNVAGDGALGNSGFGVVLIGTATGNTIGGAAAGARNVISANSRSGIGFELAATGNSVLDNYVGTDITGTFAIGNKSNGILFQQGSNGNIIDNNVVSGNGVSSAAAGINIISSSNNVVQGNFIGTDYTGTTSTGTDGKPLGNIPIGGIGAAVAIQNNTGLTSSGNTIGGTTSDAGNIIAGNLEPGVWLDGNGEVNNFVEDNIIRDNTGNGVQLTPLGTNPGAGTNNTIAGNVIMGNSLNGIMLSNSNTTGNRLTGNSIYNNGVLGINLGGAGTSLLNDSQGHVGPDNFQNFPVLNSAVSSGSDTAITGTFSEAAESNTTIALDFYANTTPDTTKDVNGVSGYGQGQTYLGSAQVTTDANGNAPISVDLGTGNLAGVYITATATDPSGNTSEFALDIQATAAPSGQSYDSPYLQSLLPQSSTTSNQLSIQTNTNLSQDTVIAAVNSLTVPSQPVTITLDLNGGTYNDTTVKPPANVTLIIDGANGPNIYVGNSPAFTVTGGNVIVQNVTFTTATDAPTILVTGGSLTLRNDNVENTGNGQADISLTGGSLELGTVTDPGNNIFDINGTGTWFQNTTTNPLVSVGNIFEINGLAQPATTPTISVTDGGTYNGSAFPATATIAGVNGVASSSLQGVSLTLDYQQLDSQGNVLNDLGATAPTAAGTYQVTASYAGSPNYRAASSSTTFTITQAQAVISITGASAAYDGNTHAASGTASGVESPIPANLTSELHLYYSSDGGNTFSSSAPVNAGTYEVYYTFDGDTHYKAVTSKTDSGQPVAIAQAMPYFSLGAPPTIIDGTADTQITESIAAGLLIPPNSETVTVIVDPENWTTS